jgi:hypothetical protein
MVTANSMTLQINYKRVPPDTHCHNFFSPLFTRTLNKKERFRFVMVVVVQNQKQLKPPGIMAR